MSQSTTTPAETSLDELEASFALPAVEPRRAVRVVHPLRRDQDATLVADSVRAPLATIELATLAMFAAVALGGAVLVALSLVA